MARIWRGVCAAVNPVSTGLTGWWCHSALRHTLTGYGLTGRQRRVLRRSTPPMGPWTRGSSARPSARQMRARRQAIDELVSRDKL
jgi:hypothetical protein